MPSNLTALVTEIHALLPEGKGWSDADVAALSAAADSLVSALEAATKHVEALYRAGREGRDPAQKKLVPLLSRLGAAVDDASGFAAEVRDHLAEVRG